MEARRWPGYADAVMRMNEANVEALLAGENVGVGEGVKDPACLSMTTESLTREFPLYTPSLLNLVKTSETRVKGLARSSKPLCETRVNFSAKGLHFPAKDVINEP